MTVFLYNPFKFCLILFFFIGTKSAGKKKNQRIFFEKKFAVEHDVRYNTGNLYQLIEALFLNPKKKVLFLIPCFSTQ